jgi:indolepyruvate ferredoxin oxidoreductase
VERVRAAEAKAAPGSLDLTEAFAKGLFKLMAYKDEYEVARLYSDGEFGKALKEQFDGDPGVKVSLAPPLLASRDKVTGHLRKREFGSWIFRAFELLTRFKFLRGTAFDPFGYTAERRMERALPGEYSAMIFRHLDKAKPHDWPRLVTLAKSAEHVRGYGHIKEANVAKFPRRVRAPGGRNRPAGGAGRRIGAVNPACELFHGRDHSTVTLRAGTAGIVRPTHYI